MRKNIYYLLSGLFLVLLINYSGCTDFPSKLVLPTWNVDLNVPVFNRSYTLQDVINKDSSMVKSYNDPARLGLLYYTTSKAIQSVTVKDNLTFDSIATDASVRMDSIKIDYPLPVSARVYARELDPALTPGSSVIFPPIITPVQVTKQLETIGQFQSALFEYAIVKITIRNDMPVNAGVYGMIVKNTNNSTQVFPGVDSTSYNPGIIAAGATVVQIDTLREKTVLQNLELRAFINSPGSGGQPVQINDSTGIKATAEVIGYSIFNVVADLPPQPTFHFHSEFNIDDSTYVQNAVLKQGELSIVFTNNLDLDLNTTIIIHNLYDPSNNEFSLPVFLKKKEQKIVTIPSLNNYSFKSTNGLIHTLPYDVSVQTSASGGPVSLSKLDYVRAVATVSGIVVKDFSGKIKPTHVDVDRRSFDLGLQGIKDKFSFGQLNIADANVSIHLSQSAGIEFGYSGTIIGTTSTQSRSMQIPYSILSPGDNTINLDPASFSNFINGFTGKLPDSLVVLGDGTANPNYGTGTVASTDSIYGNAEIELPLKLGIGAGSFADTTDLDISQDIRDKRDQISKFTVTMELSNGLPAGISVTTKLYDEFDNFLMDLPPDRAPNNKVITIAAATTDANGRVTAPASTKINVDLNQSEIDKFLRAKKIILDVSFNTSGANNQRVEFKTSDAVSLKAYGSVTYKIKS